jgi:hypothetical protein
MVTDLKPATGDVIIRGTLGDGFSVVDAVTDRLISELGLSLPAAIATAKVSVKGGTIWQQLVDARGRPFGPASRLYPAGSVTSQPAVW